MTDLLLPLRPLESHKVVVCPRGSSILGRSFPFKLKYQSFYPRSRRLLFTLHNSDGGRRRRTPVHAEISLTSAKGRAGVEGDSLLGGRLDDWKSQGLEEDGRSGGRSKNRVRVSDGERDSKASVRNSAPSKRRRGTGPNFLQAISNGRENRRSRVKGSGTSPVKRRFVSDMDEECGEEELKVNSQPKNIAPYHSGHLEKEVPGSTPSPRPGTMSSAVENESYLSNTRFEHCSLSPLSLKGIKDAGYVRMTLVQEATLPLILEGKDVLAKAKTGTGKTVAFLLPAVEVISKLPSFDHGTRRPSINVLVICPTRELALQAAAEANKLLKYHSSIGVQTVIGGTRLTQEQRQMQANPCQILIATPGRLKDHVENTTGFKTRLNGIKILVLDEADRLLDMGFRRDIERIIAAVPKQRQTLLFSATVPDEVRQICHIALKKDHKFISTVEEGSEETNSQVKQMHLVAPLDKQFSILYKILKAHILEDVDYKVIIFCTTAMTTKLVAELLTKLHLNVREIHSRKSQSYRNKVSEEFRKSKGLILVSSDVSARGVDYPDVTLVVQVGLPSDREQYIHRLGRTGRKGKEGKGMLMLAPWEKFFLTTIRDLPITEAPVPSVDARSTKEVEQALELVGMSSKVSAYQAWLGYYNSDKTIGRNKSNLVELSSEFSQSIGLQEPPAIPKLILRKMGLHNVPGLRAK